MQLRCRRCHHPFFFDSLSLSNHHVEYLWESHDMSRLSTQTFFFSILCNCTTTATHFLRHPSDKALRFFIPRKLVTAHAMRQRECKKSKKRRRLPASAQRGFVWGPQNLQFKLTIIYIPIFLVFSQVILQVIPIWSHYFQLVEIVKGFLCNKKPVSPLVFFSASQVRLPKGSMELHLIALIPVRKSALSRVQTHSFFCFYMSISKEINTSPLLTHTQARLEQQAGPTSAITHRIHRFIFSNQLQFSSILMFF